MENTLENIFELQSNIAIRLKEYENEFETMRLLFDRLPEKPKKLIRGLSYGWLQGLEQSEKNEFYIKNKKKELESKNLREEGNRLFTAKGEKRNVLGACRMYTDAIYAALDTSGDALPLGFANRAMALQSFGYYQQAYDDCCCALKLDYPKKLIHKIFMRQAYCSIKMNKLKIAEQHINDLKKLKVQEGRFVKELNDLLVAFDERRRDGDLDGSNPIAMEQIPLKRDTQEIITTADGRQMYAKCPIRKNEVILSERASAYVPVGDTQRMCHQCGILNFIPLPCLHCRGRVNYCSLKCLKEHFPVHMYECVAYRMQLFCHVGIVHFALRLVIDGGIFTVLDDLKLEHNTSTLDVWQQLSKGGSVWNNQNKPYAETLRMISHLDKNPKKEIKWFALASHLLVAYLKLYTTYFDDLNAKATSKTVDWGLLTGSLILRHIGQLITNGHTVTAIIPQPLSLITNTKFHLLNENVWCSPWHLKLGCLHYFSNFDDIATMSLPRISSCNHSCVQMFQNKFSGRFITSYALRDIKKGEEITNCYYLDYRKSKRSIRRERLQRTYHFDCRCENCLETELEDEEFNKFYQYRCDNIQCGQLFVCSDLKNSEKYMNICCTSCGHRQNLKWYCDMTDLMPSFTETKSRRRIYKIFRESEQYLVGLNFARCILAQKMVQEWSKMFWQNISFDDKDYCCLIEAIKYILNVTRERSSVNSTEYVIYMLFLWDLMAKRKYKCDKAEMDEMLWAISIVSDDLKVIFLNYYNDYIKESLDLTI